MMSLLVVGAIVVSIVLGYRTRINIGLFAIAFAYLIGCFGLGLSPKEVVAMWPLKIFFIIFSVCLFYSFAIVNGTLEKLAEHLMYRCRHFPHLLPFAIFLAAVVISALGAGYYTVLAFMAPITLLLCERTRLNLIVGAMAVNYGALAGANFVSSQSGIIFRTLMTNSGISDDQAFINSFGIFASTMIVPIVVLAGLILFSRKRGAAMVSLAHVERPGPLDRDQRATLILTLLMMATVLLPPIASLVLPDNGVVALIDSKVDIGLIASVFSVIALLMKLGDERKAIASLPWGTIIMICGVGMLISVAIEAGTIDLLGSWIGTNIPPRGVRHRCRVHVAVREHAGGGHAGTVPAGAVAGHHTLDRPDDHLHRHRRRRTGHLDLAVFLRWQPDPRLLSHGRGARGAAAQAAVPCGPAGLRRCAGVQPDAGVRVLANRR